MMIICFERKERKKLRIEIGKTEKKKNTTDKTDLEYFLLSPN